jgi:dephospho-CoA kinase
MVIGVTGGFGVGKSTACRLLVKKHDAIWIDADKIVHELYEPGKGGFVKIRNYFGEDFVDPNKGVLREKLRCAVLKNVQQLWILNKLIHSLVTHEAEIMIDKLKKKHGDDVVICLESFYLEQEDLGKLVDKVILVERDSSLVEKGRKGQLWSNEDVKRFMALSPVYVKPDHVVSNNGTVGELAICLSALI